MRITEGHTQQAQQEQPQPSWMADLQYRLSRRTDAAHISPQASSGKRRKNERLERLKRKFAQSKRDEKKRAGSKGGGGGGEGRNDGQGEGGGDGGEGGADRHGDGGDGGGGTRLSLTEVPALHSSSGSDTGNGSGNAVVLPHSITCKDGVLLVSEEALAWLDARFPVSVRAEMPREAFRLTLLSCGLDVHDAPPSLSDGMGDRATPRLSAPGSARSHERLHDRLRSRSPPRSRSRSRSPERARSDVTAALFFTITPP